MQVQGGTSGMGECSIGTSGEGQVGSRACYRGVEAKGGESDLWAVISQMASWVYFVLSPITIIDVHPKAHSFFLAREKY